jgi:hypothetical protein
MNIVDQKAGSKIEPAFIFYQDRNYRNTSLLITSF